MNYDTLLTNFLLMTSRVSFIEEPLYQYVIRRDSLSHSAATGANSPVRIRTKQCLAELYREALDDYRALMRREVSSVELNNRIRRLTNRFITPELRQARDIETSRLASVLRTQRAMTPS